MKGKGKLKVARGGRRSFSSFPREKGAEGSASESESDASSGSISDGERECEAEGGQQHVESGATTESLPGKSRGDGSRNADDVDTELAKLSVSNVHAEDNQKLSRKQREELEKKKAKERYWKLHMECKTDQAKADLARLAEVKKRREEAAKKKDQERIAKEQAHLKHRE